MADRSILIQGLIELHLQGKGGDEAVTAMRQINAQANTLAQEFKGAEKSVDATTAAFTRMAGAARVVAGFFAAGIVTNFLRDSLIGFARTERQALAVENQIKALGQAAEGAGFRSFIEQLSNASGIIDDELVPAFQRALATFKDYRAAEEALTIASKFAAAGIGDIGSNVEALNRFFLTGSARSLTQFNVNVKAGEEATLNLNEGLKLVKDQLAITGSGFDDSQKDILNWANQIDQAKDSVGKLTGQLIDLIQKGGTFLGEAIPSALNPENIRKEAEGQAILEQLATDAAKKKAEKASALDKTFSTEQSARNVKSAKDTAEKVADINEKSAQDLLKQQIDMAVQGSDERFALEIALNERVEAAAIASAKKIGADTTAIAAFFAQDRLRILNQAATDPDANTLGPGNQAGRDKFEAEIEAFEEKEQKKTEIAEQQASLRMDIDYAASQWNIQREKEKVQVALASAGQITGVLSSTFAKQKAFAIAMAIVNTALGITAVWKDDSLQPWYVKLAAIVTVAASGAAQIAAIRGANIGSGGSAGPSIASAPTTAASNPNGAQVSASDAQVAAIAGRSGSSSATTVINIGNAFGDRQSMTKLVREMNRLNANNQGNIR